MDGAFTGALARPAAHLDDGDVSVREQELQEQVDHWIRLTGCANFHAVVDEQSRFVRQSVAELDEVVEALAREARIALAT